MFIDVSNLKNETAQLQVGLSDHTENIADLNSYEKGLRLLAEVLTEAKDENVASLKKDLHKEHEDIEYAVDDAKKMILDANALSENLREIQTEISDDLDRTLNNRKKHQAVCETEKVLLDKQNAVLAKTRQKKQALDAQFLKSEDKKTATYRSIMSKNDLMQITIDKLISLTYYSSPKFISQQKLYYKKLRKFGRLIKTYNSLSPDQKNMGQWIGFRKNYLETCKTLSKMEKTLISMKKKEKDSSETSSETTINSDDYFDSEIENLLDDYADDYTEPLEDFTNSPDNNVRM